MYITYARPPKVLLEIESNPQEGTSESFKEYYEILWKRFSYLHKIVQDYRLQHLDMINKDKHITQYKPGYLVYFMSPKVLYLKPVVESLELFI